MLQENIWYFRLFCVIEYFLMAEPELVEHKTVLPGSKMIKFIDFFWQIGDSLLALN